MDILETVQGNSDMFPIKLVCQDVTHLAAIITLVKAKFCLFVLRLNVPVNNFSVMSG